MFEGVYTAIITPFNSGNIDYKSYEKILDWQIDGGVSGLIIGGSTGEGQSISRDELIKLLEFTIKKVNSRIKIIASTGQNSTANTLEWTRAVASLNIDGVMLVCPYYLKPSQEGLYQHFKMVHDSTDVPIMLYNVPGRTGVDMSDETIIKLAQLPRISSLKDASGNVLRIFNLKQNISKDFSILAGDDNLSLAFYAHGANGVVSVTSNIVPSLVVKLHRLWQEKKNQDALKLQQLLFPLHQALFCEVNPVGVKYAASAFELCSSEVKLPLVELQPESKKLIDNVLKDLKTKFL